METDTFQNNLTHKIIGCLFEVHNYLGNNYQEKYYQRAIAEAFKAEKIHYEREYKVPVLYKGKSIGFHALDFIVEDEIVLETKAIPKLRNLDVNQTLGYMNYLQKRIGLLANFRPIKLEYKRLLLPDKYIKTKKHGTV